MDTICLSDLHGHLPPVPECELLLLAGDYCRDSRDFYWYDHDFRRWLQDLRDRGTEVVAVAGNHDWVLYNDREFARSLPWIYLCDQEALVFRKGEDGSPTDQPPIRVWGSPWQPVFHDWAFNLPEAELEKKWSLIPEGIDVLLLHGPPHCMGDLVQEGKNVGSQSLARRVLQVRPRLTVCGHIHESRGTHLIHDYLAPPGSGELMVVNASYVDRRHRPQPGLAHPQIRL